MSKHCSMATKKTFIGNNPLYSNPEAPEGSLTNIDGEEMYCINHFDAMLPFFMSIVSNSDLWMYLSSTGSLTAGRQNFNNALFPYYTDDKIHDYAGITGPATIIRIFENDRIKIWEPFLNSPNELYPVTRKLFKNKAGNKIIFQETNNELQLTFSYTWMNAESLGWIRKSELTNHALKPVVADITDGLLNILPAGITRDTQATMSTLMDAYKIAEYIPEYQSAIFRLSSIPIDRAEPNEALKANVIWSHGLNPQKILLSSNQLSQLKRGFDIEAESRIMGQKTAFLIHSEIKIKAGEKKTWYIIADVSKDHSCLAQLFSLLKQQKDLPGFIENEVFSNTQKLNHLVGLADGIQKTADTINDRRHYANVMFNIMRGGIFHNQYQIDKTDFIAHLRDSNIRLSERLQGAFSALPDQLHLQELINAVAALNNPDLIRLAIEYLPLSFSRRHGDPSRPWNAFEIKVSAQDGKPSLNYQGNWRDIFQNWESLAFSFPAFLPGMIYRFLNASTADGYNPYRITRNGFDWEVPEPENPWAYIGYWGDHQIIYLLRLLEMMEKFYPNQILQQFDKKCFVYASVPYRIKSYEKIVENPKDTISFEWQLHQSIIERSNVMGADGKLVHLDNGEIYRVSFTEKVLVCLLTKLSNFVPEAGIWLTTQRPEWNDANNALVGNGASMVTLYQMKRFLDFFIKLYKENPNQSQQLSIEVHEFFTRVSSVFTSHSRALGNKISDGQRRTITDQLGIAGEDYRNIIYSGFSDKYVEIQHRELLSFMQLVIDILDQSIKSNQREDGLYHSYNLIDFKPGSLSIRHLNLMLEGQVAILSSGHLYCNEVLELVQKLFDSKLWRPDQQSFMLYPLKNTPYFNEINIIPNDLAQKSLLIKKLIETNDTSIVSIDVNRKTHFNADLANQRLLIERLEKLKSNGAFTADWVENEKKNLLEIYEQVFNHSSFTGRSGSFFKYEGIGSIYWHMVSKLLLALGENITQFAWDPNNHEPLKKLIPLYYRIKEGIGSHKNPKDYGAFPTDPYSHTPFMKGVQQPGLTGQVKEDIISRFNELGLEIKNGSICFNPVLIRKSDCLDNEHTSLSYSFCGTPVYYIQAEKAFIEIEFSKQGIPPQYITGQIIPKDLSNEIFSRSGTIASVKVGIRI